MAREIDCGAQGRARSLGSGVDRRHDRRHQILQPAFVVVRGRDATRLVLGSVDEGHRDADQRDSVAHRMMRAGHHRRAALVLLDDMDRPERMGGIERLGGEIADKAFERLLAAGSRQPRALDVMRNVEVRVVAPVDAGRRVLDPLPVSTIGQKPVRQLGLQPVDVDRSFQYPDAEDDHQIGWPVHAQPRRVDRRHALGLSARDSPNLFRVGSYRQFAPMDCTVKPSEISLKIRQRNPMSPEPKPPSRNVGWTSIDLSQ